MSDELETRVSALEENMRRHRHLGYDQTTQLISTVTSPASPDTSIQFNNGGIFGGDSKLLWDKNNSNLGLGGDIIDINNSGFDLLTANGTSAGSVNIDLGRSSAGDGPDINLISGDTSNSGSKSGDIVLNTTTPQSGTLPGRVIKKGNTVRAYNFLSRIATTDATPGVMTIVTAPAHEVIYLEARVTAERSGGSGGSAGDAAVYVRRVAVKRIGSGAATIMGSVQDVFTQEDQAGWDCTFVLSTNAIQLQVTGAADNTILWQFEIYFLSSSTSLI